MKETTLPQRAIDLRDYPRKLTSKVGRIRRRGPDRGDIVWRDPKQVTRICVHQMGAQFGAGLWRTKQAGGDEQLAIARRMLKLPYHQASFDGFFARVCPIDWYTRHGNAFNATSLGLGIDGRYPEMMHGGSRWRRYTHLSDRRVEAARTALRDLLELGLEANQPIGFIVAHRQSNAKKPGDPGEALWKAVVEDYAIPCLKLRPEYTTAFGGNPIPLAWRE